MIIMHKINQKVERFRKILGSKTLGTCYSFAYHDIF